MPTTTPPDPPAESVKKFGSDKPVINGRISPIHDPRSAVWGAPTWVHPYYLYMALPDFKNLLRPIMFDLGYGSKEALQDFVNKNLGLMAALPPRDKPLKTGNDPAEVWDTAFTRDKAYFPDTDMERQFISEYITPMFTNPFEFSARTLSSIAHTPCSMKETAALECVEYYGIRQGRKVCADYYADFQECRTSMLQVR